MSAGDLAAVIVVIAGMTALFALLVGLWLMMRSLGRLEQTLTDLKNDTIPAVAELRRVVGAADEELERVDGLLDSAEVVAESAASAASTVDAVNSLVRLLVVGPLVRLLAALRGTRRFVMKLAGRDARPRLEAVDGSNRELAA